MKITKTKKLKQNNWEFHYYYTLLFVHRSHLNCNYVLLHNEEKEKWI